MTSDITTFVTRSGLEVQLRPLRPDDAPLLVDLFQHLGPESRYQRFQMPLEHPDPAWVERAARALAAVPPPGRGWLALADLPDEPGAVVGGGRYVVTGEGTAEVSVTIRDDLQGQGIGTAILRVLITAARGAGIRRLTAYTNPTNRAVMAMVHRLHLPHRVETHAGETYIEIELV